MIFEQALQLIREGRQLHRAGWPITDGYLVLMPGMKHIWKIVLHPNPNAGNYIFSVEDLLEDDWQEFVVPDETIEHE